ncbi:MAG: hypothetical protein GF320_07130 [Armatimonadia bacterium]|nr:hypothetical protein [Armatimonadia bacterium]
MRATVGVRLAMMVLGSACIGLTACGQPAGESLLPEDALTAFAQGGGPVEIVREDGGEVSDFLRITTAEPRDNFWEVQAQVAITEPVREGDTLVFRCRGRMHDSSQETGQAYAQIYFQIARDPWTKSLSERVDFGPEWTEVQLAFRSLADYAPGEAALAIGCGFAPQVLDVAGISLVNLGQDANPGAIERKPAITWPGRANDAPWRAAAEERIERIRKGDLTVTVTQDGEPVEGAEVSVRMTRHAFGFGSTVAASYLPDESPDAARYREHILELFNRVSIENDLKWPAWAGDWGWSRREATMEGLRWLDEQGLTIHGHVLVWPSWRNVAESARELRDDPPALRRHILDHIEDEVTVTRPFIEEWDVVNEPFSNHDLMDLFGRDVMVEWSEAAHEASPEAKLYINDYSILAAGGMTDTEHQQHYEDTIRFLLDGGAPLHGIGLQSHFGSALTPPETLLEILDRFAQFGLPLQVTEFDVDIVDHAAQAEYLRDFYTALFSHESVEGIVMWGFWEGRHWKPNAALFTRDWQPKPNAEMYRQLVFEEWWTDESLTTGADGAASTRGFLGEYEVTVTIDDERVSRTTTLDRAGAEVEVSL